MSVGTIENYRTDFNKFKKNVDYVDTTMTDWDKEYLIKGDVSGNPTPNTVNLMKKRIDNFAKLKCDYVEMDNMDADQEEYVTKYKTNLTINGMKKYNTDICNYIQGKGMKCVFKNQNNTESEWNKFDALTLESEKDNVEQWKPEFMKKFIDAKKPVWISHYGQPSAEGCEKVYGNLKNKYGNNFGMVCSVYDDKKKNYIHYG
jgi:hypothetical protein